MAISVDPSTFVITIPKADLTLIQSTPIEVRELDVNDFRHWLRAWEATAHHDATGEGGAVFLKTHDHNTEVSLGGIVYARIVEILDPYTITFENGSYAVNVTGGNSNIGDKVNLNTVQVRINNSAGNVSQPDIEYASFNGGVLIDETNGTSGTLFPIGTIRQPSDNWADALLIAQYRGLNKFYVRGTMTMDSDADVDGYIIEDESDLITNITIDAAANVQNCAFSKLGITGVLDGNNQLSNCLVGNLTYVNGRIMSSILNGKISLAGGEDLFIENSGMGDWDVTPEVDMGGSGQDFIAHDYVGKLLISNLTGANKVGIGLAGGVIMLNTADVTAGTIHVSGVGRLTDELGNHIPSGTWNGGVTILNELVCQETISTALNNGVIETNGSITVQQALSVILAALAGETENDMQTFKDPSGTSTRITGTVASGDRTGITLTPSS